MEYPHMPYPDSITFPFCLDGSGMDFPMEGIDPKLKRSTSPEDMAGHWSPPQMHRYLTDNNKSAFFAYSPADTIMPGTAAPFPSTIFQRQHSPSFSHPSSTCSSALSPPRESDYCQMQSPTPTETGALSPYSGHYDGCGSHSQLYQYTGMADACVKPIDVNPYQESPIGYYNDNSQRCGFTPRTLSMSTDDSHTSVDQCNTEPLSLVRHRQLSPEGFMPALKEEFRISSTDGTYPPFEVEEEGTSGDEIEPSNVKIEEDDDDDYMPNKKARRSVSTANRVTKRCKRSDTSQLSLDAKRIKIELDDSTAMRPSSKPAIQGTKGSYTCSQCANVFFKDLNGLDVHIKKKHTRPFTCVFEFAGCASTFASKNEWKRHCCSQHLVLNYWVCQQDQCAKVDNNPCGSNRPTTTPRSRPSHNRCETNHASTLPHGTIFNRKDLYTQHLRRMHLPSTMKKQVKQRKTVPDQEERERAYQEAALRTRCQLPTHMRCPAANCNARFDGPSAWDDRMEHVAKHLEKAAAGTEPPIYFGGEDDKTLMDWATGPDVAIVTKSDEGAWGLRNPLKPSSSPRRDTVEEENDDDLDADGEEVDE